MEVFIRIDSKTNAITFMHMDPFNPNTGMGKTKEELCKEGFLATYQEPTCIPGKRPVPYYDIERNSITHKYEAAPLSDTERINLLENAFNEFIMSMASASSLANNMKEGE